MNWEFVIISLQLILKKTVHNKICSIYSSLHFCPNAFLYSPSANVIERINFK